MYSYVCRHRLVAVRTQPSSGCSSIHLSSMHSHASSILAHSVAHLVMSLLLKASWTPVGVDPKVRHSFCVSVHPAHASTASSCRFRWAIRFLEFSAFAPSRAFFFFPSPVKHSLGLLLTCMMRFATCSTRCLTPSISACLHSRTCKESCGPTPHGHRTASILSASVKSFGCFH